MKLATYEVSGEPRLGAVEDDAVIDLNGAAAAAARGQGVADPQAHADSTLPADAIGFLTGGDRALSAAREALAFVRSLGAESTIRRALMTPVVHVRLRPPVPNPPKIVCIGRNFAKHAQEAGFEPSEYPIMFPRFAATLVAHGEPLIRPAVSTQFDWEGELAVVIGRRGRHITRQDAFEHVAGYSVFNDATVRDYQFRTTQYTAGKNFSNSGGFGPYLVTRDEVADPHALEVSTYIDDEQVQSGNTGDFLFDIPRIIQILSEFVELEPGDVIPTGTPSGVGFKREPPRFLQPGQRVRVEVTDVGTLENPVVDEHLS